MASTSSIVNVLESGLNAANLRRKVISHNIANLDTPNFRRNEVKFESLLKDAMESGLAKPTEVEPEIRMASNTPVKLNGNDVNLEIEIGEMMKNARSQKTYLRLLNKVYKQMEMAMQDRI